MDLASGKPVNLYVVICHASIDRRLESLTNGKTDAAEPVLDGRPIGAASCQHYHAGRQR
jgi:hypothetical protein